jgi:translation initiation factor IF-3
LVGEEGEQLGIVSLADARARAEAAELDLVEIAPTAKPPVCRIMDYGKFKYREAKKQHEAKLKLKQIQVKEVKFRPGTDEGDYHIKLRNLIRFLGEGDRPRSRSATAGGKWRTRNSVCAFWNAFGTISSRTASSSRGRGWRAGKW